jgi:antibiotic biosynthesis monooxygenase (ABM) superfamily enzyme
MLALMDLNIMLDGEAIEPFKAIGFAALVVMLLVVLALAIVLSVFGSLIFFGLVLVGSIAMVTLGIFWPILLVAAAIWLVIGGKTTKQYA